MFADRNLQGKNVHKKILANYLICTLSLCSLLSDCFHASAQVKELVSLSLWQYSWHSLGLQRCVKDIARGVQETPAVPGQVLSQKQAGEVGTLRRGKDAIRVTLLSYPKGSWLLYSQASPGEYGFASI